MNCTLLTPAPAPASRKLLILNLPREREVGGVWSVIYKWTAGSTSVNRQNSSMTEYKYTDTPLLYAVFRHHKHKRDCINGNDLNSGIIQPKYVYCDLLIGHNHYQWSEPLTTILASSQGFISNLAPAYRAW